MGAQKGRQPKKTGFIPESNGGQEWGGTFPLFSAPDHMVRRVAQQFVRIANGKLRTFSYTYSLYGGGVISGDIQMTDGNRAMVRRWLAGLPKPPKGVLDEIAASISDIQIGEGQAVAKVEGGKVEYGLQMPMHAPNDQSALAYLMGLIMSGGYADNVRSCPQCGKWFFDARKGRPPRKFCSDAHANAYRQSKHRDKKAKGKSK